MIKKRKTNPIHIRIIEKYVPVLVIGFKGVSKKKKGKCIFIVEPISYIADL